MHILPGTTITTAAILEELAFTIDPIPGVEIVDVDSDCLFIDGVFIKGDVSEMLIQLPSRMTTIVIKDCVIEGTVDLSGLKDKTGLKKLVLTGVSLVLESLSQLPSSLRHLDLDACKVDGACMTRLSHLTELDYINLSYD